MLDPDSPGNTSPAPRSPHSSIGHNNGGHGMSNSPYHSPELGSAARTLRHHPALASASLSPALSFSAASRSSYGGGHGTRGGSSMRSADSMRSGGTGAGSRLASSVLSAGSPTMLPPMASSRDPFLLAAADKEPTSKELKQEIEELERERRRLEQSWKSLERAALARAGDKAPPPPAEAQDVTLEIGAPKVQAGNRVSTLLRKASFNSRLDSSYNGTGLGFASHDGRLSPIAASPRETSSPVSGRESPRRLTSRSSSPQLSNGHARSFTNSIPAQMLAISSVEEALPATADPDGLAVDEVRRRRRATDERYEKRLEYLRARLRGALLKEGLRG